MEISGILMSTNRRRYVRRDVKHCIHIAITCTVDQCKVYSRIYGLRRICGETCPELMRYMWVTWG
jgi:hypothetical protein